MFESSKIRLQNSNVKFTLLSSLSRYSEVTVLDLDSDPKKSKAKVRMR